MTMLVMILYTAVSRKTGNSVVTILTLKSVNTLSLVNVILHQSHFPGGFAQEVLHNTACSLSESL